MANFNLVVDTSNFKPFTYDELMKPLLLYKQEEDARQQAYLELQEKASVLEALANSQQDRAYYEAYMDYKNRLLDAVEDMNRNGNTRANNQVFDLRRQYIANIEPLSNLLEARNKLVEEQRLNDKDHTNMYTIDYSKISLDDMKKMGSYTYDTINGNILRAMSAETFAPLAKQIFELPEVKSILGGKYFREKYQNGFTLDQLMKELEGTVAGSAIYKLKSSFMESLGMAERGFTSAQIKQAERFVDAGATSAIGQTIYNNMQDPGYMNAAQQYALDQAKFEDGFKYQWVLGPNGERLGIDDWNPKFVAGTRSSTPRATTATPWTSHLEPNAGYTTVNFTRAGITRGSELPGGVPSDNEYLQSKYGHIPSDNIKVFPYKKSDGTTIGYEILVGGSYYTDDSGELITITGAGT